MKQSGQCLKCKCRRLLVIEEMCQPYEGPFPGTLRVCATMAGPKYLTVGKFQVIVCTQCGYTEWYAYDFESLKQDLSKLYPKVRLIENEPSGAPYR